MNSYNVIVLGPSGSGKTVFLASMYHKLSIQRDDTGFFIVADPIQQRRLIDLYRKVASPGEWPEPTHRAEVSEWRFTCNVRADNSRIYPAFEFTYLDYSGETLTDESQGEESGRFYQKLEEADALLGILDGYRILDLMHGGNRGSDWLYYDLSIILTTMMKSENPIHFVITKWDLLQTDYSLEVIRDRLMAFEPFNQLVQTRNRSGKRRPVRLIPVSSIGMGFAELEDTGIMRKHVGITPHPFQVEMPLACVLPDKLQVQFDDLLQREIKLRETAGTNVKPEYGWNDTISNFFGGFLGLVRNSLPERYKFSDSIFTKLIDFFEAGPRAREEEALKRSERIRRDRENSLKTVQDEKTAIEHAIESFIEIANSLKERFPTSDLSKMG